MSPDRPGRRSVAALLLASCLALPGCYSKVTAYDGKLTVGYMSAVQVENFVKPIAPGAKLDLVVFANGTSDKLRIATVTSSKPGVLAVHAVKGETVTVSAGLPGVTELTFTATDASGQRITDRMFFHVAKPAAHGLEHACTEEPKAAYVRGAEVAVFHHLATADRRPVVGYDYVPVEVSPASALDFVAQPQAGTVYRYRANRAAPAVTITSRIDGKRIEARIVEPAEIKTARFLTPSRMLAGTSAYAVALVSLPDGTTVCSQNALTRARSLTPEICKVTARIDDSLDDSNREQLAEIEASKFGTCRLQMTLPELGDRGIVLEATIPIGRVEYPGDGKAEAEPRRTFPTWPLWSFLGLSQLLAALSLVRRLRSGRAAR